MDVFKIEERDGMVLMGVSVSEDAPTSDLGGPLLEALSAYHNRAGK